MKTAVLLLVAILAGCAPTQKQRDIDRALNDYIVGDYASARQLLQPYAEKADEDFVLNNVRLGSAALAEYELDEAEAAFLRAYEVINSVGVNDGGRSLGAVLVDEKIRIWKGEPFERAMANFYLGLIYYMRQDYANARGAFENALFKLRDYAPDAEEEDDPYREIESNFALGSLMLAKSYQRLGRDDLARANFDRVKQVAPEFTELADERRNERSNLLLIVEFGFGPMKQADFDGSIVGFGPTPFEAGRIPHPRVTIDGKPEPAGFVRAPVDTLALAQDRRWQSIDTIRTVKSAIGTGLIVGGAAYGLHDNDRWRESLAMMGAGLLLKATSQADVRQWEMLPRTVFVIPLRVEPGTHDVTVQFPHSEGLRQTWRGLVVPPSGEATYYMRMLRWNDGPFDWPPPAMQSRELSPEPVATEIPR